MVFKTKVDIWMAAIFIALPLAMLCGVIIEPDAISLFITALIIILMTTLYFGTKYVIEGEELVVYGGIYKKRIPIKQIRSLRPTKNPFSAPAMSLDRIEITVDPHMDVILVSPKDKELFVKTLLTINPQIKLVS